VAGGGLNVWHRKLNPDTISERELKGGKERNEEKGKDYTERRAKRPHK